MTAFVHEGRRSFVVLFAVLAMIVALLAIPATPANAVATAACPATIPSAGFTDLAGFSVDVVDAANCLAFYGITKGTSATTYGPAANVSRWQMALFLTRQAVDHGVTLPSGADQGFTDLTGLSAEAVTAINQLAQLNITKGTSATTFDPNGNVGRWQMALFITRLVTGAGITLPSGADQGFTDIGTLSAETQTAINQTAQLGISKGTTATTFDPTGLVTRAQMALFLTRTLQAGGVTPPAAFTEVGVPQLVSATFDASDSSDTRLLLKFDEAVSTTIDGTNIWLVTWWGDLVNPSSVQKGTAADVVEAIWDTDDYNNATTVVVTGDGTSKTFGAVTDISGNKNITGSVPLQSVTVTGIDYKENGVAGPSPRVVGATPNGKNGHPELISVGNFSDSADTVEFTFDSKIDDDAAGATLAGALAGDFVLVLKSGALKLSDAVASTGATGDDVTVKAAFTTAGLDATDWSNVRRAYVVLGTVADSDGDVNPGVSVEVNGGVTDGPDLASVTFDTDATSKQVTFKFDETLNPVGAGVGTYRIWYADGTFQDSTAAALDATNKDEVDVSFGATELGSDVIVHAGIIANLTEVNGFSSGKDANVDFVSTFSYSFAAGHTVGADLIDSSGSAVGLSSVEYEIELTFDEDVEDGTATTGDFQLEGYDADGKKTDLSFATIGDNDGDEIITFTITKAANPTEFGLLNDGKIKVIVLQAVPTFGDIHGQLSYPDSIGCGCTK